MCFFEDSTFTYQQNGKLKAYTRLVRKWFFFTHITDKDHNYVSMFVHFHRILNKSFKQMLKKDDSSPIFIFQSYVGFALCFPDHFYCRFVICLVLFVLFVNIISLRLK